MKESNEYIHYSVSLVYKNIYTIFLVIPVMLAFGILFGSHTRTGLQLQKDNAEMLPLEHAWYSELTNSTREEMYVHTRIFISTYTHANRISRYHLPKIPLIYMREKGNKVRKYENSISVPVLAKCLFLIYPAILCLSIGFSSQLQQLRSLITNDLRAIESRF